MDSIIGHRDPKALNEAVVFTHMSHRQNVLKTCQNVLELNRFKTSSSSDTKRPSVDGLQNVLSETSSRKVKTSFRWSPCKRPLLFSRNVLQFTTFKTSSEFRPLQLALHDLSRFDQKMTTFVILRSSVRHVQIWSLRMQIWPNTCIFCIPYQKSGPTPNLHFPASNVQIFA